MFDPWLRSYIDAFKYKSIDTKTFQDHLFAHFAKDKKKALLDAVDWESWFHAPGMPPVDNKFDSGMLDSATTLAEEWLKSVCDASSSSSPSFEPQDSDMATMATKQKQAFLNRLLAAEPLSPDTMKRLDDAYGLSASQNAEVKFLWQLLGLRASWVPIFDQVTRFITEQGRMKFVRPLYRALFKCEAAGTLAVDTFKKYRSMYHNIASTMVAKDLGVE